MGHRHSPDSTLARPSQPGDNRKISTHRDQQSVLDIEPTGFAASPCFDGGPAYSAATPLTEDLDVRGFCAQGTVGVGAFIRMFIVSFQADLLQASSASAKKESPNRGARRLGKRQETSSRR